MASPGVEEGGREAATAKQEVAGALRARATPRLCLLAEEEEDKGEGGLGRLGGGTGPALVAARVRPGNSSALFYFIFCSVFLLFNSFATVLN